MGRGPRPRRLAGASQILSNTTEAGYTLDPEDTPTDAVPRSFPASCSPSQGPLDAGQPAPTIIPCELIEGNAGILREAVVKLATDWNYPAAFVGWMTEECVWLHTLVDRIVTGTPKEHPLLATDPMVIVAEPFAFWA